MSGGSSTRARERRVALAINIVLLVGSVVTAVLTSDSDDWHPLGLVATLALFALVSELLSSQMGHASSDAPGGGPHFTSSAPGALAVVFLGAAPALGVALIALAAAIVAERTTRRDAAANFANYSFITVTAALVAELGLAGRDPAGDGVAAALAVMGAYLWIELWSNILLAVDEVLSYGRSIRRLAQSVSRILLTVEAPLILLAGFTAYIYAGTGLLSIAVLAAVQILFVGLARALHRSYDRAAALTSQTERISELSASRSQLVGQILLAEERERRRLAEALMTTRCRTSWPRGKTCHPAPAPLTPSGRARRSMPRSTSFGTRSSNSIRPSWSESGWQRR